MSFGAGGVAPLLHSSPVREITAVPDVPRPLRGFPAAAQRRRRQIFAAGMANPSNYDEAIDALCAATG